jgi:proline iminopeptidase
MKIFCLFLSVLATCCIEAYPPQLKEVFVEVDGAKLFCRTSTHGAPIVVIHGGPGLCQEYLLPYIEKLADSNFVIFYDQRGCGRSSGALNAESINLKTFLNDLESIRKFFGYKKITVLGHSWGGFLAMQYAIAYPESIDKLILLNTIPASSEERFAFIKELEGRPNPYQGELKAIKETQKFAEGDPTTVEKYYRSSSRVLCYDPQKVDLLNFCMESKAFINGLKVNSLFEENLFKNPYNLYDLLKLLNIPTLIIHGDSDPIPPACAEKIHESIRASQYILLKNCGHFPYVESSDELFRQLSIFLKKDKNSL